MTVLIKESDKTDSKLLKKRLKSLATFLYKKEPVRIIMKNTPDEVKFFIDSLERT